MNSPKTETLQDMLAIVQQQRDQALNALVLVQAENAGLRRHIAVLAAPPAPAEPQADGVPAT